MRTKEKELLIERINELERSIQALEFEVRNPPKFQIGQKVHPQEENDEEPIEITIIDVSYHFRRRGYWVYEVFDGEQKRHIAERHIQE